MVFTIWAWASPAPCCEISSAWLSVAVVNVGTAVCCFTDGSQLQAHWSALMLFPPGTSGLPRISLQEMVEAQENVARHAYA